MLSKDHLVLEVILFLYLLVFCLLLRLGAASTLTLKGTFDPIERVHFSWVEAWWLGFHLKLSVDIWKSNRCFPHVCQEICFHVSPIILFCEVLQAQDRLCFAGIFLDKKQELLWLNQTQCRKHNNFSQTLPPAKAKNNLNCPTITHQTKNDNKTWTFSKNI